MFHNRVAGAAPLAPYQPCGQVEGARPLRVCRPCDIAHMVGVVAFGQSGEQKDTPHVNVVSDIAA